MKEKREFTRLLLKSVPKIIQPCSPYLADGVNDSGGILNSKMQCV